jgi:hypothetical protein
LSHYKFRSVLGLSLLSVSMAAATATAIADQAAAPRKSTAATTPATNAAPAAALPTEMRTLDFHSDKSLGMVTVVPTKKTEDYPSADQAKEASKAIGPALGKITFSVPRGCRVAFEPNRRLIDNPKQIEKFSPEGIDSIYLLSSAFDESEEDRLPKLIPYLSHFKGLKELHVDRSDLTDAQLLKLPDLNSLEIFTCSLDSKITGACLARLSQLPNLRYLDFWMTRLDEDNLKYLKNMHKLEALNLSDSSADTTGMKHVSACTGLKRLYLNWNKKLIDEDLTYLIPLNNLQLLHLRSTPVTDRGMPALARMKRLKTLSLLETKVTADGIYMLKPLHLQKLTISDHSYSAAQIQKLKEVCVDIEGVKQAPVRPPDRDTLRLFAPLSRHGSR